MSLTDLFKPKWRHSKAKVRRRAVQRLSNPAILAVIAMNEKDNETAEAAARKISDPWVLADVARNGASRASRFAAMEGITEQSVLACLACGPERGDALIENALRRVTDQALLGQVAQRAETSSIRYKAVGRLDGNDKALLTSIFVRDREDYVREAALDKIADPDQSVLREVLAQKPMTLDLRFRIATRLSDPAAAQSVFRELVAELRGSRTGSTLCESVVSKLTDPNELAAIAKDFGHDDDVRFKAFKGISDQVLLAEIAMADRSRYDDRYDPVPMPAAEKLTDPALLARLVRATLSDRRIREIAIRKLRDVELLTQIAELPEGDSEIREAVKRKLALLTKTRTPQIGSHRTWECPDCGAVQNKDELGTAVQVGWPSGALAGAVKCGQCGGDFLRADVYGGCYDLAIPQINVLVFCLQSSTSPSDAEGYCRKSLQSKYPDAQMKMTTVVGRGDRYISEYEATSAYKSLVAWRRIASHGRLFDRFPSKGPDGRDVYVLVFVP
jgi:hypothetical protein